MWWIISTRLSSSWIVSSHGHVSGTEESTFGGKKGHVFFFHFSWNLLDMVDMELEDTFISCSISDISML